MVAVSEWRSEQEVDVEGCCVEEHLMHLTAVVLPDVASTARIEESRTSGSQGLRTATRYRPH